CPQRAAPRAGTVARHSASPPSAPRPGRAAGWPTTAGGTMQGEVRGAATADAATTVVNALSIDVEEYYHAHVFRDGVRGAAGLQLESRVEESVDRVLALLDRADTKATFFVLGQVASDHPALVRKIAAVGHEIA